MYSMYIDETGINEDVTLLAGVIINSDNYLIFCKEIDSALIKIFGTKELNLKEIRRKVYQENIFPEQQYARFFQEYYELLAKHKPTFIICGVKDSYLTDKSAKVKKAYQMLLERFHLFLKKKSQFGQIIYDKGDSTYMQIHKRHKDLIKNGSSWGWQYEKINNIYDQDDNECRALQVADLLAYSAYLNFNRKRDGHFKRCSPFFDKGPNGQVEGYGIKILS